MVNTGHKCKFYTEAATKEYLGKHAGCWRKFKKNLLELVLVSSSNPLALHYFRSTTAIREERKRQIRHKNRFVIHPFSKFRAWYEIHLSILYLLVLISKPIDAAFCRKQAEIFTGHRYCSVFLDIICWIDIFIQFFTGYLVEDRRKVEFRLGSIAKHYVTSPYFICDLLSSIPRQLPYFFWTTPNPAVMGVINICLMLKFIRIYTLMQIYYRITEYFRLKVKGVLFLYCSLLMTFMIIHWNACLQFAVPRMTQLYFRQIRRWDAWIYRDDLYEESFTLRYTHSFFKSSALVLGIRLRIYRSRLLEEFLLSIFAYILGKILVITIWIILALSILSSRSMMIKYHHKIGELDEYLRQKQIPIRLRNMMFQYYNFKYQKKFFKEGLINSLISSNLRKDVDMHVCKSLLKSVSIFSDMNHEQLSDVVARLIRGIYLPKDTIIQSGSPGDSMYFISSGTVAVYTHSGKEICHLEDGAYFGEISLVVKNTSRMTTVIAIEICQIYQLKKSDFEKYLFRNKKIMNRIIRVAEQRVKNIRDEEEKFKKQLFEKSHTK